MASDTLIVPARFNGPPAVGQGGYDCGVIARHIGACTEVTLREPSPPDTPVRVERAQDDAVRLFHEAALPAEGRYSDLSLNVRPAPSLTQAEAEEAQRKALQGGGR